MITNDDRKRVHDLVQIQNDVAQRDLLDPHLTQDDLIALLQRCVLPAHEDGLAYKLLLTSIHSDHGDDSALGPHGHARGFAVDIGTVNGVDVGNNEATKTFVRDMIGNNTKVTKVGTIGAIVSDAALSALANNKGVVLFEDEGTGPHVHLQTT
jgi:hypothetical protein